MLFTTSTKLRRSQNSPQSSAAGAACAASSSRAPPRGYTRPQPDSEGEPSGLAKIEEIFSALRISGVSNSEFGIPSQHYQDDPLSGS